MSMILCIVCISLYGGSYENIFYKALRHVESTDGRNLKGDNGSAIGVYQIHKIYVDDVNRIYKTKYKYEDRWDPKKSHEIVTRYLSYYGSLYTKKTGKNPTIEVLAQIHNGGPNGWKKESTRNYGRKVLRYVLNKTRR